MAPVARYRKRKGGGCCGTATVNCAAGRTKWTPTDSLAFVGGPPLFRPPEMPVYISVTFTWDLPKAHRLAREWGRYYRSVRVGGPACDDPGGDFTPGLFMIDGVTITSRGCPRRCPWCVVPRRSGAIRELELVDGHIIQDDNVLACSRPHVERVFEMLGRQKKSAQFRGGLDARLLRDWHRSLFDSVRHNELWFACDTRAGLKPLARVAKILDGIPIRKRRCYVLLAFDPKETVADAEARCEAVYELGFLPFAQLYQPFSRTGETRSYPRDWRALSRKWSRPAAYRKRKRIPVDPQGSLAL